MTTFINNNAMYNINNWKEIQHRAHEAYICIPTSFNTNVVKMANVHSSYIIQDHIRAVNDKDNIFQLHIGNTKKRLNREAMVDVRTLNYYFTLSNDEEILPQNLLRKCWVMEGNVTSEIIARRPDDFYKLPDVYEIKALAQNEQTFFMNWVKVKRKADKGLKLYAFFLDINKYVNFPIRTASGTLMANAPGVPHGKGDFIVAYDPELKYMQVVNGLDFPILFSMQQFRNLYTEEELTTIRDFGRLYPVNAATANQPDTAQRVVVKKRFENNRVVVDKYNY